MFNNLINKVKEFFSKGYIITFESGEKAFIPTKGMTIYKKLEVAMCPVWEIELDSGEKLIRKTKLVDVKRRFRMV